MPNSYYLVRVGPGGKYAQLAHTGGYIAIGWGKLGDLSDLKSLNAIKKALKKAPYDYTEQQVAIRAGQINRFLLGMKSGDTVLTPIGHGTYIVGIAGDYYHEPVPQDGCEYVYRRKVEWADQVLRKDDMSTNLSYSLGSALTIFSLDKYTDELEALIAGEQFTPAEKPQRIREYILSGLFELDGREFEIFLMHLLEVIGFRSEVTRYTGDKGIDVIGTLDAGGLAEVNLRIQAKRVRYTISRKDVAALRGDLEGGQLGCFITLSSYSKEATEAAEAPNVKPIKLVDADDLAGIILKNFDDLDDEYKTRFRIRRKKNYNIEEQFEPADGSDFEEADESDNAPASVKPDWDTIVCPAREDGFKSAFLKEKAWWAIRINERNIPHIKYIAMYQVAPLSQITHYGEIDRIEPYENTGKFKIFLKGDPLTLAKPVGIGNRRNLQPQGSKYAILSRILSAANLDDVWG